MNFKDFEDFLLSEKCFKSHDVSIIREGGLQDQIDTLHYWDYQSQMARHLVEEKVTIKVEQMERHWKFDDRTIHLFYNPKFGPTFDEHTDPVDVIIEVKAGSKSLEVDGLEVILTVGDKLMIPAGTKHKALNYEKALIASHGIGDTETLNRIHKDH
tara:strand:- start:1343 stop:1810 length:468 start_codon:yes stop_codon:yes gene_type:complete